MKVLLLTQVLPFPPDSGPKVKTWNLIQYLSRAHEVTLVSFVRGDQSAEVERLREVCRAVHTTPMTRNLWLDGLAMLRSLASGQPWLIVRDERKAFCRLVDHLAAGGSFDLVHADQLNMAQFAAGLEGTPKVVDTHNALWLLYKRLAETMRPGLRRLLLERDWRLMRRYEGTVCRQFDAVLAVSQEDRAALEEAIGRPRDDICVIPIAVDTDAIQPVARRPDAGHILHIGTMYWPPNIDGILWFARQVYPLIRAQRPGVVFDVVGARPPAAISELASAGSGINVTGYVADPLPYIQQAGVSVVPLRAGGGMRVKILNAMAQGLPIVSTTIGCEGIGAKDGRHLLIADEPQDFAAAVLRLLEDRALAEEIGRNGRELVETVYDYRVALRPLDAVYSSLQ